MKWILIILVAVVIVNLPPFKFLLGYDDCKYSNGNGAYTFDEANFSGRDYKMASYKFAKFKEVYKADTILYRLCPMNILHVWKWWDYLSMKKYRLPYKSWEEIAAHRVGFGSVPAFQDF